METADRTVVPSNRISTAAPAARISRDGPMTIVRTSSARRRATKMGTGVAAVRAVVGLHAARRVIRPAATSSDASGRPRGRLFYGEMRRPGALGETPGLIAIGAFEGETADL